MAASQRLCWEMWKSLSRNEQDNITTMPYVHMTGVKGVKSNELMQQAGAVKPLAPGLQHVCSRAKERETERKAGSLPSCSPRTSWIWLVWLNRGSASPTFRVFVGCCGLSVSLLFGCDLGVLEVEYNRRIVSVCCVTQILEYNLGIQYLFLFFFYSVISSLVPV